LHKNRDLLDQLYFYQEDWNTLPLTLLCEWPGRCSSADSSANVSETRTEGVLLSSTLHKRNLLWRSKPTLILCHIYC